jgi:hypothetical protein
MNPKSPPPLCRAPTQFNRTVVTLNFKSFRAAGVAGVLLFLGTNSPAAPVSSQFDVRASQGALTSLQHREDSFPTEYIAAGKRLGDVAIKYRQTGTNWLSANTATLATNGAVDCAWQSNQGAYTGNYRITNGTTPVFALQTAFNFQADGAILWTLQLTNLTAQPLEIGDLALPLPMNTRFAGPSSSVFKHSFISGNGSYLFWMRPNSVGPYLTLTPLGNTPLEYWDAPGGYGGAYEVFIHSAAAGAVAAAKGTHWRQTNTSLALPAGGSQSYGFRFRWANDYDGVRQVLVDEGKLDIRIVPGMTVPTNLCAQIALRTKQEIARIDAEFPAATRIQSLGTNGTHRLYQVQFSKLGENKLTIRYGDNQRTFLEFFVTEPVETLIRKRAAFLVSKQVKDSSKWYDGLYAEWNLSSQTLVTPDNYDQLVGFVRYEVAADDSGLSRPAYLAAKNAVHPVQSEVASLDYYINHFVWGGLQRTTNETHAYGIYGVQDWYTNRHSSDPGRNGQLHIWRAYDYPHIVTMYYGMYQVAKHHPEITTELTAKEYLRRAYGTAIAMFTVPSQVEGWSAYETGFMNEMVISDLIEDLKSDGLTAEAAELRKHWETKVNYFAGGDRDLFASEYAFDSTGFESLQALARYALQHADTLGTTNPAAYARQARRFMDAQMKANIFCRGWLEPAYYHYGSDYRGAAGDRYLLSYMAQMGGWAVLDYALYYATNAADYLQLGYASALSSWALMNTGTPESNYGYWYPGAANDGGAGGGFEPSPYNRNWLGQPVHRGSWFYSCEINLGYCAAVRTAATVLADDPVFGRICYGGSWSNAAGGLEIIPKDGVRQRFHAQLAAGKLHLVLNNDNFHSTRPIVLRTNLSSVSFTIQTANPMSHAARARFTPAIAGTYTVTGGAGVITTLNLTAGQEVVIDLPLAAATTTAAFTVSKQP